MEFERMQCCGVFELNGLSDHGSAVEAMKEAVACLEPIPDGFEEKEDVDSYSIEDPGTYGVVMFSAAGNKSERSYGENFATYIREHSLGAVVATPPTINRNTGRTIKVWLWKVNPKALVKWGKENGVWVRSQDEREDVHSKSSMGISF